MSTTESAAEWNEESGGASEEDSASIIEALVKWANELVSSPKEDAKKLDELPVCFQWRDTLERVATLHDASVLDIPTFHGALFFGPPGNGKHTLARAYISTLRHEWNVKPDCVKLFRIGASQFPEGLDLQKALDRIGILFNAIYNSAVTPNIPSSCLIRWSVTPMRMRWQITLPNGRWICATMRR